MFDQLVSSNVPRRIAPTRGLVVGMLHGVVIACAIRVTALPPEAPARPVEHVVIFDRVEHPPVIRSTPADPTAPSVPTVEILLPPVPVDVPTGIPPVTPGPPIDPDLLRRILSTGTQGTSPAGGDSVSMSGVLAAAQVDEPAVVLHQPSPRYPPVLQQAGIEGRVLVEFIIDTTGHIEAASLRVLESSNHGFDAAAGETVRGSVFRPGRVRGSPVRQRTIQSIAFRIAPER